jgi:hypothetical protein
MSWNQAHAPLLIGSFPKTPRTRSNTSQFNGYHNYKTRQNKLPIFIDGLFIGHLQNIAIQSLQQKQCFHSITQLHLLYVILLVIIIIH